MAGGLISIILLSFAIGSFLGIVTYLTINWLINKINKLIAEKRAKKVVVSDISNLAHSCDNVTTREKINNMANEGYSKVIVALDNNNRVIDDIEVVKDKNTVPDSEVEELLGRERMVVVEN